MKTVIAKIVKQLPPGSMSKLSDRVFNQFNQGYRPLALKWNGSRPIVTIELKDGRKYDMGI